jgi:hypothetical protein
MRSPALIRAPGRSVTAAVPGIQRRSSASRLALDCRFHPAYHLDIRRHEGRPEARPDVAATLNDLAGP